MVDPMKPSIWMPNCTKCQILVQLGGEKVRLLNKPNKKMVSDTLLETYSKLKCIILEEEFSIFTNNI